MEEISIMEPSIRRTMIGHIRKYSLAVKEGIDMWIISVKVANEVTLSIL